MHFIETNTRSQYGRLPTLGVRWLFRSLCLVSFVCFLAGAAAASTPNVAVTPPDINQSFLIADLDGDLRPDMATVQTGQSNFSRTDYWIQVQLSARGRQTFRIVAPIGGLQIVSRDVNGDQSLDLVLTSTWLRQPVAVLLNDGHGGFTRVEPEAFPGGFATPDANLTSSEGQLKGAADAPPPFRNDLFTPTEFKLPRHMESEFIDALEARNSRSRFFLNGSVRAPPFELPQL